MSEAGSDSSCDWGNNISARGSSSYRALEVRISNDKETNGSWNRGEMKNSRK